MKQWSLGALVISEGVLPLCSLLILGMHTPFPESMSHTRPGTKNLVCGLSISLCTAGRRRVGGWGRGRRALRAQGSVSPDPGPPEAWIDDTLILEVWDPERWGVVRRGGCEGPGLPTWSLGRKTCETRFQIL